MNIFPKKSIYLVNRKTKINKNPKMKTILFLPLLLISIFCQAQEEMEENIIIGDYMLVPEKKEVRVYTMIGGVDWDGFEYQKVPEINYDTTTMLILGEEVFFKEKSPFEWNIEKLKPIYRDDDHFVVRDDKSIYFISKLLIHKEIDVSNYTPINDLIYRAKDGKLFFLDIETYQLSPIELEIDLASVKHIAGAFFYDKNGLYFFGEHYKKNTQEYYNDFIKTSEKLVDGQNITPLFSDKYIAFKDKVFAISTGKFIKELNLNLNKIIEVQMKGEANSLITDGQTVYSDTDYGYDERHYNQKGLYGNSFPVLYSGVNLQKIYSPFINFEVNDNTLIFNKNHYDISLKLVVQIDDTPFLLMDNKKTKINKMLFYRPETKTTEIFDDKQLKIFKNNFILYGNTLYFNGIPVKAAELDIKNLREIENSDFLTDGKSIFYIGEISGFGSITIDGVEYATFEDRIMENAYTPKMKAVNKAVLSDGVMLISQGKAMKISDLKLDLRILR